MKRNETCFEVTPPCKKKAPLEPSPILVLEKFKKSPSLLFDSVKVGLSVSKGFWVENPNDCTTRVILAKLPPAKRGLSFSVSEFFLDPGCSRRIEVKWTPTCEGSWRDCVQVEAWGLPPPHLSFRVIIHLSSVIPKIKQECCQVAPLRSHNVRSSRGKAKSNVTYRCSHLHPPPKAVNGRGKENVVKKEPKLAIGKRLTKRPSSIDRDSLEDTPPGLDNIEFVSVDDGSLPPCDVPLTPIRRNTYCVENSQLLPDDASNPLHAATFLFEEKEEVQSSTVARAKRFFEALEERLSPTNFSEDIIKAMAPKKNTPSTPTGTMQMLNQQRPHQGPGECSKDIKGKKFVSVSETNSANHLFPNVDKVVEETKNVPMNSTTLQCSTIKVIVTPPSSPITPVRNERRANVFLETPTGFHVTEQAFVAEITTQENIKNSRRERYAEEVTRKSSTSSQRNWRRIQDDKRREIEKRQIFAISVKASIVIQRSWRFYLARKRGRKVRAEMWALKHNACCVIQRSWRYYIAIKQARKYRASMWQQMNEASFIIQRSFRLYLARKKAREDRAVLWYRIHEASSIIQRNFRLYLVRKKAREDRAVMWQNMNEASSTIQRSFKMYLARKKAREHRAVIWKSMNDDASTVQRSFRLYLARKNARKERAVLWKQMNEASSVIQRGCKRHLARKRAREERAVIRQRMNEAASVIQRSFKLYLARKKAREERAAMWQSMNEAASVIQHSWRLYVARKVAAIERAEMWMLMHDASCVIQKCWRSYAARKQAARERAEVLAAIKTDYDCDDAKNSKDTVKPEKPLFEILEKFHLKPRAYELLFELADLHPLEYLYPALKHIQSSMRNGELISKTTAMQCDKKTQTLGNGEFSKPVTKLQTNVPSARSSAKLSARRSLLETHNRKSLMSPNVGFPTPLTVSKSKPREVPEKERWSSVAEAVGRLNFTPQK